MSSFLGKYAVFGKPISHSKSPQIHQQFAAQFCASIEYSRIQPKVDFASAIGEFFQNGGNGCNVTVPYKQAAYKLVDHLDESAKTSGAVNTIKLDNGKLCGFNTDGVGLLTDICHNHNRSLSHHQVLLLGAGGAARGIINPLMSAGISELLIANRTLERAAHLARDFANPNIKISAIALADLAAYQHFDLLINATSMGLAGELPALHDTILKPSGLAVDLVYGDSATVNWAQNLGIKAIDGCGMLVEQAAQAFYIWTGLRPESAAILQQLRHGAF